MGHSDIGHMLALQVRVSNQVSSDSFGDTTVPNKEEDHILFWGMVRRRRDIISLGSTTKKTLLKLRLQDVGVKPSFRFRNVLIWANEGSKPWQPKV